MMKGTVMLFTNGLRIGYPGKGKDKVLFENLHLELNAAQLVCFMGPNGIGKSSLIRTLAGLQNPMAGKIEVMAKSTHSAKDISIVLTDRVSHGNMTVHDLVTLGRYPYLDWKVRLSYSDREIIDRAIARVNIESLRNQQLSELSDGQMQMVMIARALAQDTPIILLDEPTAHLDLNNRVEIMKLLKSLAQSTKKAILVSTHELDLALQMADWIWLSGRHQNILTGIPEDLVLEGAFDSIFQFKGFDLKTGKVQHEPFRGKSICMKGTGPEYMWTKNALERNGFNVHDDDAELVIVMEKTPDGLQWHLRKGELSQAFRSIADVLKHL
jgi:iron complex transport system ATP-binding protein